MGENNIKPKQEAGEAMSIKVKDQSGGEVGGPGEGGHHRLTSRLPSGAHGSACPTAYRTWYRGAGGAACGGWVRRSTPGSGGAAAWWRGAGRCVFETRAEAWRPTWLHLFLLTLLQVVFRVKPHTKVRPASSCPAQTARQAASTAAHFAANRTAPPAAAGALQRTTPLPHPHRPTLPLTLLPALPHTPIYHDITAV
jgi:hypothetical protein